VSRKALQLGLVGVGRWGGNIVRTISESRRAELAGVASRNPRTADIVPRGCRVFADWQELITDTDLDGVIVATPPALHPKIVLYAIEAGLPVLVEKPLALSIKDAREVRTRVGSFGGGVMVDHTYLYHPAWIELKRRLPNLGPIEAIRSSGGNRGPFRTETTVLWDWGPHDISMCIDLIGGVPEIVSARRLRTEKTPEGRGDLLRLDLGFATAQAKVEIGNLMSTRTRRFEVEFAGTTAIIDDTAEHKLQCGGRNIPIDGTPPLTVVIEAFVHAVAADSFNAQDLDLAVMVVDTLERCDSALARVAC
jgi:predicted dehydrogenase